MVLSLCEIDNDFHFHLTLPSKRPGPFWSSTPYHHEEVACLSTPVALWLGIMAVIGVVMVVMKMRKGPPKS